VFPEILERIAGRGQIHYFVLTTPRRDHQLVDSCASPTAACASFPESHDLLGLYARRVAEAAAGLRGPPIATWFPTYVYFPHRRGRGADAAKCPPGVPVSLLLLLLLQAPPTIRCPDPSAT